MAAHVKLGVVTLPVPPQPWPIVCDVLGVDDLADLFSGGQDAFATVRARFHERPSMDLHGLLAEFIPTLPDRLPLHEWGGYASPEAMEAGERDRASAAKAPDLGQIAEAIKTIVNVNGGGTLGELLGVVRDMQALGDRTESSAPASTPASPISPGPTGEPA